MGLVAGRSQYNWEHGIPCMNPHCKSYGKPHPNCLCTSAGIQTGRMGGSGPAGPSAFVMNMMAEGGQVHFCSQESPHEPGCEYYAGDQNIGQSVIKNAIGRHTSEDELTDSLLGKSNPELAAHGLAVQEGASGLLGDVDDSLYSNPTKSSKLVDIANEQLAKKANKLVSTISMLPPEQAMSPDLIKDVIRPAVQKLIGRNNPHIIDAVITAISRGETGSLGTVINHASKVSKGSKAIDDGVESLFSGAKIDQSASGDDREKLKEFIGKGGLNAQIMNQAQAMNSQPVQAMAEGGMINANAPQSPIDKAFPEQSMLLGATKSSVNNYLQQQRPQGAPKLPFDTNYKNEMADKKYDRALDVANKPLSVLSHIQSGTITPEHVQHMIGMYPDLYNHLGKKVTERVMKAQLDDERPSYRARQGMSLFLHSPLDSTMTPQSIQSIQGMYAPKPSQPPPGTPPKKQTKNTSKLGEISQDHFTQDQASQKRATAWD